MEEASLKDHAKAVQQRNQLLTAIKNHKQVKGRFHTEQATRELYRLLEEIGGSA